MSLIKFFISSKKKLVSNEVNGIVQSKETLSQQNDRSEEVSDIIDKMPTGWTSIVSIIVVILLIILGTLSFYIKYPDTITGRITLTGEIAPVRIVSNGSGRLHLLVPNNESVYKGECLGYLESGASYNDIILLDSICRVVLQSQAHMDLPNNLVLGSLSSYYNEFVKVYNEYIQFCKTEVYNNMRQALDNKRKTLLSSISGMEETQALHEIVMEIVQKQYNGDSILFKSGAISDESFEQSKNKLLSQQQSSLEINTNISNRQCEIEGIEIDLAKIDITVSEESFSIYSSLLKNYNALTNSLIQWKEMNLFISPINGKLEYLGFWRENVYVNMSTELFSISPDNNNLIGELVIPTKGAGKVEVGQEVNVKLDDYPYEEYGHIKGFVSSISTQVCKGTTQEDILATYLVKVSFQDNIQTNYKQAININYGVIGTGEIITKRRRLIQRLFDNLKSKTEK